MPSPRPSRLWWLWYLCISLGFVLLSVRALLLGAPAWTVALRLVIAAGFFALALFQRRERPR
ncbi:MAG: hypothetical protein IT159_12845 [Bryobacterales bacterium]|nr:hypothetical protein [Bryobacterales bacterium]